MVAHTSVILEFWEAKNHKFGSNVGNCYSLCLDVPTKPRAVIGRAFSEVAGSKMYDAGIKAVWLLN